MTEVVEELAILKAAEDFDSWQDCTCADIEDDGTCWYHLTDDEQMDWRVKFLSTQLDIEKSRVRQVLAERGDYD